jgi:hypothetical protein
MLSNLVIRSPGRRAADIDVCRKPIAASVRRVEDITEALRGTRVSPSTVSELNKKIYGTIEACAEAGRACLHHLHCA